MKSLLALGFIRRVNRQCLGNQHPPRTECNTSTLGLSRQTAVWYLWRDKTCPARTYLIMSWKALLLLFFLHQQQADVV